MVINKPVMSLEEQGPSPVQVRRQQVAFFQQVIQRRGYFCLSALPPPSPSFRPVQGDRSLGQIPPCIRVKIEGTPVLLAVP